MPGGVLRRLPIQRGGAFWNYCARAIVRPESLPSILTSVSRR